MRSLCCKSVKGWMFVFVTHTSRKNHLPCCPDLPPPCVSPQVDVAFAFGEVETVDLVPGGASQPVTGANRAQYAELYTQVGAAAAMVSVVGAGCRGSAPVCVCRPTAYCCVWPCVAVSELVAMDAKFATTAISLCQSV
jgi:hypothetical protein